VGGLPRRIDRGRYRAHEPRDRALGHETSGSVPVAASPFQDAPPGADPIYGGSRRRQPRAAHRIRHETPLHQDAGQATTSYAQRHHAEDRTLRPAAADTRRSAARHRRRPDSSSNVRSGRTSTSATGSSTAAGRGRAGGKRTLLRQVRALRTPDREAEICVETLGGIIAPQLEPSGK
jgi:hypothetical protein